MNSDQIYENLKIIGTATGSGKIAQIKAHADDEDFCRALKYAYNPYMTFGVKEYTLPSDLGEYDFHKASVWELLDELAERKLTGSAALDQIRHHVGMCTAKSRMLFKMIVHKDLRCGIAASSINKAIPGLVPTFDCMLAAKFDAGRIKKWPVAVEPKLDGVRVLAFVTREDVTFYSRSGKEFTTFDHLKQPLMDAMQSAWQEALHEVEEGSSDSAFDEATADFEAIILDGEVVSGSFNETVSQVRKKDEQATDAEYHVFDAISVAAFESPDKKGDLQYGNYEERRALAEKIVNAVPDGGPIKMLPSYRVSTVDEIHFYYRRFRDLNLEGVIVKDRHAPYHFRRNPAWMKIKAEESVDVPIVGAVEGTGKYEGSLGALIVDFEGVQVNVGTGIDDSQRAEFWKAYQKDLSSGEWSESGALLGRLIEVQYHEITPDKSLRHPRFIRFRDDKAASW